MTTLLKRLTYILAVSTLAMGTKVFADPSELQGEIIEVEEAIADSEAAKTEAAETANRLLKEKKEAGAMRDKANSDLKRAKREQERSQERIALNEKRILEAQDEKEKAKKDIEDAKDAIDKMKIEMDKVQAEVEKTNKEAEHYADLRKEALAEKDHVYKEMKKKEAQLVSVKRMEKSALKDLTRAESDLRNVREKAKKSYADNGAESKEYMKIIDGHREAIRKISKKLDEIEVEVEVDKAYDEKKERKEIAMAGTRSLASLNTGKFAKITAPTCNVRTFPSADSKVIGAYKQGRKVHVRIHDKSWYTTVYNGEKVFMGAGCFQ
jgi:DNA repair exonuclease SbcCD ATPase subunit